MNTIDVMRRKEYAFSEIIRETSGIRIKDLARTWILVMLLLESTVYRRAQSRELTIWQSGHLPGINALLGEKQVVTQALTIAREAYR